MNKVEVAGVRALGAVVLVTMVFAKGTWSPSMGESLDQ